MNASTVTTTRQEIRAQQERVTMAALDGSGLMDIVFPAAAYRYAIGTRFRPLGRHKSVCVVVGYIATHDVRGTLLSRSYQCQHTMMGQVVEHVENETTIARGVANLADNP